MKKHNEWTKRTTLLRRVLLILVSFLLIGVDINASYSLRQFSSKNGLSNSAILSMCQDRHGVIWIGSCDGLNIYDGTYLGLYKPTNVHHSFSGNLIERIIEADNDVLSGIRLTADALKTGKMRICGTCADCLREMDEYVWDLSGGGKDRVKKENDHAMDDMRYFAATVLGSRERGGFAAHAVSRKRM